RQRQVPLPDGLLGPVHRNCAVCGCSTTRTGAISSGVDVRHGHDVEARFLAGGVGDLDAGVVDVVELQPQRPGRDGVHDVRAGDVGQLEDGDLAELVVQDLEHAVGD